jgi:membrane-bound serine protease (ClpP class)
MAPMRVLWISLAALAALGIAPAIAQPSEPIDIVEASGFLDEPVVSYIELRLDGAEYEGDEVVVLQMDLPAALDVDVEALADRIGSGGPPIVAWVAPRGATLGAEGAELARATDAVFAAADADLPIPSEPAASLQALLQALDGRTLEGTTLETWDEDNLIPSGTVRFHQMNVWDRMLHAVASPEVALMLLLIGLFGFVFEIYNPGIGLAAIVGAGSLALAMYAFGALPTNWGALLVIVVGTLLLVADVQLAGLGALTLGGLAAVVAGSVFLFPRDVAALALSPWAIVAAAAGTIVFFVSVMTAALRVRLRRPVSDEDRLVGTVGEAKTDIAPEGTVVTKGALWRARTMETGIAAGAKVKIMATEGLVLLVEPLHEEVES